MKDTGSFVTLRERLRELRGEPEFDSRSMFEMGSEAGSHPSSASLSWQMVRENYKNMGPLFHPDRFKLYTADLWAGMTRSTLEFIAAMDTLLPDRHPMRERFVEETSAIDAARNFLAGLDADRVLSKWRQGEPFSSEPAAGHPFR